MKIVIRGIILDTENATLVNREEHEATWFTEYFIDYYRTDGDVLFIHRYSRTWDSKDGWVFSDGDIELMMEVQDWQEFWEED